MDAVSIHGLALSAHGTSLPPDRNTTSSQGALMETMDAVQGTFGPQDRCRKSGSAADRYGKTVAGKARAIGSKAQKLSFSPIQKGKLA